MAYSEEEVAVSTQRNLRDVSVRYTPDNFTVRDLLYTKTWIPTVTTDTNARLPLEFTHEDGKRYGFAQSHKGFLQQCQSGIGDVSISRGKLPRTRQVFLLGWDTAKACIEKGSALGANGIGLCLSGTREVPSITDVGVIDFDYKPDTGEKQLNAIWRNEVRSRLIYLGMPIIPSMSGNGFHALFRTQESDDYLWEDRSLVKEVIPIKRKGAGIDFYPPGTKRLVNIVWEKIEEELLDASIPRISHDQFQGLLYPNGEYDGSRTIHRGKCELCQGVNVLLDPDTRKCLYKDACKKRAIEYINKQESLSEQGFLENPDTTIWREGEASHGTCSLCERVNQPLRDGVCHNETKCYTPLTYERADDIDAVFLAYFKKVKSAEDQSLRDAIIEAWEADGRPLV